MPALVWLLLGIALIVAEVFSGDFVLVMLGIASLGAAVAESLNAGTILDLVVFLVLAAGLIVGARPLLKRRFQAVEHTRTNVDALKGSSAVVVATVNEHGGQVRIGGEIWSARAYENTQVFEPGQKVIVMDISGATAIVWAEI